MYLPVLNLAKLKLLAIQTRTHGTDENEWEDGKRIVIIIIKTMFRIRIVDHLGCFLFFWYSKCTGYLYVLVVEFWVLFVFSSSKNLSTQLLC